MTGHRLLARPLVAPLVLCAIGVGFVGRVGVRATRLDPLPVDRIASAVGSIRPAARAPEAVDVTPAIELDPFRPERNRPPVRYAVPGDAAPSAEASPQATPSALTLVGTVMSLDGSSFAMVAVGGAAPRVVRVGQVIGGLTLKKVEQGKAMFRSAAGETIELTVPKAGQ